MHLDGALELSQSRTVDDHLNQCSKCRLEFSGLDQTRNMLAVLGRKAGPADLALRLRVAISREASAVRESPFAMLRFRLETA
jgi:predicted anti-sigma-YlaC factor YlaD